MISLFQSHASDFLSGFGWTIVSSVLALIGSLVLGTIFALLEVVPNKVANIIGRIYFDVSRKHDFTRNVGHIWPIHYCWYFRPHFDNANELLHALLGSQVE